MSAEVIATTSIPTAFERRDDENPGSILHVSLVVESSIRLTALPIIELAAAVTDENAPMRIGRYDRRSVAIGGISPAQARTLAGALVAMADEIDRFHARQPRWNEPKGVR